MTDIMDLSFPGQRTTTAKSCIPHDSVYIPGPRAGKSENGFFRCDTWLQIFQNDSKIRKQKSNWLHSSIKFANPDCTAPGCVLNVLAGLLPASRWWPDILPGQRNFSLVKSCFWLVKILGKKLTYRFVIFTLWTQLCFFKETKFKIYRRGFGCFFMNESACMTSQCGWRLKFLARQVTVLARYCPLTGGYFEPRI